MTKTDTWQTRPLVREDAPKRQDSNFEKKKKISGQMSHIWARHQDILTDWPSVAMWLWLWLYSGTQYLCRACSAWSVIHCKMSLSSLEASWEVPRFPSYRVYIYGIVAWPASCKTENHFPFPCLKIRAEANVCCDVILWLPSIVVLQIFVFRSVEAVGIVDKDLCKGPNTGVGNCFGSGATLWKRRLAEGRTF
jgi:hypothetical protein